MDHIEKTGAISTSLWLHLQDAESSILAIYAGLALLLAISLVQLNKGSSLGHNGHNFKNEAGEPIKELERDTRFARFLNGGELSREGKDLAEDDPYLIRNGSVRELVISTPNQLQAFLHKDSQDHYKPKNMNLGDYAGKLLGQCVAQQRGQKWKTMRSYFDPEFSYQSSRDIIPMFSEHIDQWLETLPKGSLAVQPKQGEFAQNAMKECKLLASRLIALSMYGDVFDETIFSKLVEFSDLHQKIVGNAIFGKRLTSRLYNMLPTIEKHLMDKFQADWEIFNNSLLQSARQQNIRCPAEHIFRGVVKGAMTRIEFLQTLDEILFTNIDITSSVLTFILINLASNIPFQEALRAEIKARKSQASYNVADFITHQNSLLHCVTLESLRISPALLFSPAECTAVEKTISGYRIPAGTPTMIDMRRLNTNVGVWGPDGEVFRFERFLDMSPAHYRYAMLRFGIGPGKCMGKNMADVLLKMTIIAVLERYMLSPCQDKEVQKEGSPGLPILFTPI